MAKYLVAVNTRYKEYYVVDADDKSEAMDRASVGAGAYIESLFEYVEMMDPIGWDDPIELTEEEAEDLVPH